MPQLQRAQLLHQQGRIGEAWTALAPLRSAIDSHGQALRLYALVAQSADRIDEAIGALERIAVLERDPPEIIGALADMLGQAGRYSEALPLWDRLVARHPELADAHLNRAIAAANAGRHELAVEAAVAGLKRFPGHARLLATRAMALKNAGRIEDAVKAFEVAVAADPDRALTRHNQAVALRAACRYESRTNRSSARGSWAASRASGVPRSCASSQPTTRPRLRRACAARSGVALYQRSPADSASATSGASGRWHASHEAARMARPRSRPLSRPTIRRTPVPDRDRPRRPA